MYVIAPHIWQKFWQKMKKGHVQLVFNPFLALICGRKNPISDNTGPSVSLIRVCIFKGQNQHFWMEISISRGRKGLTFLVFEVSSARATSQNCTFLENMTHRATIASISPL